MPQTKPPKVDYTAFLQELTRSGAWFCKPRSWIRIFGSQTSDLLLALLNSARASGTTSDWIRATEKFISSGIGISPDRQAKLLDRLTKKGLVEVRKIGAPAQRHVRIDLVKLREYLDSASLD